MYLATSIFNNLHKHFSSSALQIDDKNVLSDMEVCGVQAWCVWLLTAGRQAETCRNELNEIKKIFLEVV